jgi:phospholipase/carboxylesterase
MSARYVEKKIGGIKAVELPGDPNKGTIVLLHGFGADCYDLASLSEVYEGPTWVFPQGPLQVPFTSTYVGRAWFPVDIELLSKTLRANRIEEIRHAFPPDLNHARSTVQTFLDALDIPPSHLILGGFSQGAVLALEVALNALHRCAGLLIFSGTYIDQLNWNAQVRRHANTSFFQSHGTHDSLLPIKKAEELEKFLLDGGLQGKLHTFHGGHEIPHTILVKLTHFLENIFESSN